MTVTRDVVLDLLPLYVSGDASADTRALVEAFLATDPQLARIASGGVALPGNPPPATDTEVRASLARTRRLLQRRQIAFGMALTLTLMPLSFAGVDNRLVWMMWRDAPAAALVCAAGAAVCWMWFARVRAALRAPGF